MTPFRVPVEVTVPPETVPVVVEIFPVAVIPPDEVRVAPETVPVDAFAEIFPDEVRVAPETVPVVVEIFPVAVIPPDEARVAPETVPVADNDATLIAPALALITSH